MTCRDCYHYGVCMDYTSLRESEFAQTFNEVENICEHFKDKSTLDEVVRCKDCIHYSPDKKRGLLHSPCDAVFALCICHEDSFCSYGKRKGGEK